MSTSTSFLSTNFFHRALLDAVQSSPDYDQLLPILRSLPLCEIKAFLTNKINSIKQEQPRQLRSVYYNSLSINAVLPTDVIQRILTFDEMYHSNVVCKKWKSLSEKNETNYLKQIYKNIPRLKGTLIAHPARRHLHPLEKDLDLLPPVPFEMTLPFMTIEGRKILVHDGIYRLDWSQCCSIDINLRGIQIIGLSKNVIFECCGSEPIGEHLNSLIMFRAGSDTARRGSVHFDNIIFRRKSVIGDPASCVKLYPFCFECNFDNFTIKNCEFNGFDTPALHINPVSLVKNLNVINCKFIDTTTAFYLAGNVNANVRNCLFQRCGKRNDMSRINEHPIMIARKPKDGDESKYVFENNIFEDCELQPIVENTFIRFHSTYFELKDHLHQYVLTNNKITDSSDQDSEKNANQIWKIHNF